MEIIMKKVFHSAEQAIDGLIFDGMKIAAGGFGLCGIPEESIAALKMSGIKNPFGDGNTSMRIINKIKSINEK